ncbi:LETM1-related biofilm-associated protein [Robertkochia solimangrovi]|uniref:LETM1-related biofilm-associated protein n=1 Tax=Robertkochia solimangrovi TaxID=2213046 RepID=UPI0011801CD8|nr:LETM1-related biofilm-associated protein [Robertkochia solimangrovi]TRZ42835.1 hypothetical protein DMZ48_12255 [Robertkochia solimangrovi]
MNPSAQGWIDKFGTVVRKSPMPYTQESELYLEFRNIGFIYGANIAQPSFIPPDLNLSEDELAKLNLLSALYSVYQLKVGEAFKFNDFLKEVNQFYSQLKVEEISFFSKLLTGKKTSHQLEVLLHKRVTLDDNFITRSFNSMLTNALLFLDVIAFRRYLEGDRKVRKYAARIERIIINLTYHTLNSKEEKSVNDHNLLRLFESSLRYNQTRKEDFDGSYRSELFESFTYLEKKYFIDLSALAAWEDHSLEYRESDFIHGIGKDLNLEFPEIEESLSFVGYFFDANKSRVSVFKSSNPVKMFYDNSYQMVRKLITRNSKRLLRELSESRELLLLLSKSTTDELDEEERKKVREQLLDIFKAIPSLAIFALPGGAILLPIFIKLIPKLLPSAFDDNRIEKETESEV